MAPVYVSVPFMGIKLRYSRYLLGPCICTFYGHSSGAPPYPTLPYPRVRGIKLRGGKEPTCEYLYFKYLSLGPLYLYFKVSVSVSVSVFKGICICIKRYLYLYLYLY